MSTQPSFGTLYRQSRYSRTNGDGKAVTRQNRQELFAVAGVAFLIKHDASFRRTFLRSICGVAEADLDRQFEVEVQPAAHADLRLRCAETKALYIVEFKLGAFLQSKQNPAQPDAFFKPDTGYGWTILNAVEYSKDEQRTYVVLQNWRTFEDGEKDGVRVLSRAWKDLIVAQTEESLLTRDLLDTLGGWGIATLRFRHTTHMTKAKYAQDAADLFQIVTVIAEEIGIKPQKFDFDVLVTPTMATSVSMFPLGYHSSASSKNVPAMGTKTWDGLATARETKGYLLWMCGSTANLLRRRRPHRRRRWSTFKSVSERNLQAPCWRLKDKSASASAVMPSPMTSSGLPRYSTHCATMRDESGRSGFGLMKITERFEKALAFAVQLHRHQFRKGGELPYIGHLLGVCSIALENGANEDEAIAALLHDSIEDQAEGFGGANKLREHILAEFGETVLAIVEGCTDAETIPKPPWRERKETYIVHLAGASASVLLVSASDKLHNARAILQDYLQVGEALWSRFNGGREGTLWYYRALCNAFHAHGNNPLRAELERTVRQLEALATKA